ncbi:hypothetical protein [Vibrio agarivorans]|uniref:hypothetical protein n=1 Tax=Vibrio agarivorans TaxID=153622 RepID=UPI0025B3777F|nr:hypothetical protein [Vibrio agarivorans]MDN3659558.1 hypothetical protein [Vibrio agarivorans]MDN3660615.1 hypothetical protein [Vibrio agarivorans]MDN3660630.1 hypothetical protein [Vibrio agarivorans]MDN3661195.1 hypothetical protein [Vibrio agarivorans]MDN3663788.1 hypothetical protein [Vibrio agarivorans]
MEEEIVIESRYWKEDLAAYARRFKPVSKPLRYTEKRQVNFEKDVIISLFMVRKLTEANKLSSRTTSKQFNVYGSKCIKPVNSLNFWDIDELYDLSKEDKLTKTVQFIANQLVHGSALYAYRDKDRNWGGVYTCSDFERHKYVYKIPVTTIIEILEIASEDYPTEIHYDYNEGKGDYSVTTD